MVNIIKSVFILFFLFLLSCKTIQSEVYLSTSFHEPATDGLRYIYSEDGIHWDSIAGTWLKPEVGTQKVMRDPSITRTPDGSYHMVWTSSWKGDLGFGYAHSKDLIHWSDEQLIPVMAKEPTTVNVWAPEIFYDDAKKEFVVVWASCVPNRYERGVEEENNNHRLYYITTKDFKTISETKLFYDPGFSVIDATIVKRGINDYVLVLKDNTRAMRNLKVAFGKSAVGPYSPASVPFTESFVEGPTVAKVANGYLIYFDMYGKKIFGAMQTSDFVHFQDMTDEVKVPQGHKHGTMIKVPRSDVKKLLKTRNKSMR